MLWMKDPDQYRRRYYDNEPAQESEPMRFGKKIAEVLESRDYSEFPSLAKVDYYPVSEHPIEITISGVPIKAYLDLWNPETFTFGEVKTGSVGWSDAKVAKHEQLPFYSFLIKKMYGRVDPFVNLIYLPTQYKTVSDQVGSRVMEAKSRELELTGDIQIFTRRIADWERNRIRKMIVTAAGEISKDYEIYTNIRTSKSGNVRDGQAVVEEKKVETRA